MTSPLRRIRVALSLGAAIVLTCAGALSVGAQTTGVIRGKVIDGATTRPVDGAQVYVAGTELGTLTNSDGQYQFAVRAGTVEVRTRRVGYASTTKQVTVTAGQVTDADITLNKAAIALRDGEAQARQHGRDDRRRGAAQRARAGRLRDARGPGGRRECAPLGRSDG